MLRKELGDCLSTSGKISQGGTEAWVGNCYAEGRMKGRKCQRKGNKQHEQRCCSSCEKAGFLGRRDVSRKQQKRSMRYYLFFKFTYFLKNPLSNNFMRGNRSSKQASEMCAIGQRRKESTATQGHPFSIIRVPVVLFLLLQEVKAMFSGPRLLLNRICGPLSQSWEIEGKNILYAFMMGFLAGWIKITRVNKTWSTVIAYFSRKSSTAVKTIGLEARLSSQCPYLLMTFIFLHFGCKMGG